MDMYLEDAWTCMWRVFGRVSQCMLMCREISLEASGNRHALHVL